MSDSKSSMRPPHLLYKQRSWSPDTNRDETWSRRKGIHRMRRGGRSKSVTDEDLNELKACFELGFGFDSPYIDPKLADAFPALELYYAVNNQYSNGLYRSLSSSSETTAKSFDCDSPAIGSPSTIFESGDDPEMVKMRLRQWAQVVACSVRQTSPSSSM